MQSPFWQAGTPPSRLHACVIVQGWPQVPQLSASVLRSAHAPPQLVSPEAQQMPPRQALPPAQAFPQVPQLPLLVWGSTQAPPQLTVPVGQPHVPF